MNKEIKDVIILAAKVGNGMGKAMEDNKLEVADLVHFAGAAASFPAALAGCTDIPAEIASFTDEDRSDLCNTFCVEFDITQDSAEAMVEKAIQIVIAIWNFVK